MAFLASHQLILAFEQQSNLLQREFLLYKQQLHRSQQQKPFDLYILKKLQSNLAKNVQKKQQKEDFYLEFF